MVAGSGTAKVTEPNVETTGKLAAFNGSPSAGVVKSALFPRIVAVSHVEPVRLSHARNWTVAVAPIAATPVNVTVGCAEKYPAKPPELKFTIGAPVFTKAFSKAPSAP
jgi:hypothetical protein